MLRQTLYCEDPEIEFDYDGKLLYDVQSFTFAGKITGWEHMTKSLPRVRDEAGTWIVWDGLAGMRWIWIVTELALQS